MDFVYINHYIDGKGDIMTVYVVTMYRYGNKELHSYVLDVFTSRDKASYYGALESVRRGGKYDYDVVMKRVI